MTNATGTSEIKKLDNKYSNFFLLFGIALIVLGILAIVFSVVATISTIILFGALLVVAGVAQFVHLFATRGKEHLLLHVLSGLLYLITGWFMIYNPLAGALSLTLLMSGFFIAAGILRCAYAVVHRKERMWGWFLLGGIANLALGTIIASGWPVTGFWVIGLFVGIEMLTNGIAWIALSMTIKDMNKAFV